MFVDSNDELDGARRAVDELAIDHPEWPHRCKLLASMLLKRFQETSQDTLLAECIDIQRRICAICNTDRAASVSELASSLRTRFAQTGEVLLLTESIVLSREALSLRPIGHPDRSISCMGLASSLWRRFEQAGEHALLTEAIDLEREALSLRPRGHPDRSITCNSLAVSLWTYFYQTGEDSLLAESIDLYREALLLQPNGHPDRHKVCNNLANSLYFRFDQTGVASLLTESIELYSEALSLLPSRHLGRSEVCNNLASSLRARFHQTGEESLLIEAIDLLREALFLQPSGHPDRFKSYSNLALSLCARFKQAREESLLVEAIHLHRQALSLQTSVHPLRLEVCNRLVASLRIHFESTGDESLLVEAIDISNDLMKTQPQHNPSRWNTIITLSHIYLNPRFSKRNTVLAINYIQEALSLISDDWPTLLSEVSQLTTLIDLPMLSHDSLLQLLQCFSAAVDLAFRVAGFVLDPESQLIYLSSCQHLGPRAYWCALVCQQPQLGLELIERTRAVMWTQALHMRNPQVTGAPPVLASELEVLLSKMHTLRVPEDLMSLSSHDRDVRHKNSNRIHQLIQEIRALPGQERFMRGLSFEDLAQCASRNAVVVLVATEGECHALIIQPNNQEPVILELSDIAPNELTAMSVVVSAAQRRGFARDGVRDNYRGMKASHFQTSVDKTRSNPILGKLWMTVVRPVINHMQFQKASGSSRPRLHWCPTGPFMSLPLHAAGMYDTDNMECCADYVVCSYTPTLSALLRAQKSNPSFHRYDAKLGLIASMEAWDAHLPVLPNVEEEISNVRAAAERACVSVIDSSSSVSDMANMTRAAEVFKSTTMAHVACHGAQNATNALSSGFCLSDGNLSVSRLMDLDLRDAFFAFLSACETAKGDEKQPDQIIHLAAAMLFVGFRSVVATMWAMDDADGPLVARLFYERLFAEDVISLDAVPHALDFAVAELRKSGVSAERWATFIHMGA